MSAAKQNTTQGESDETSNQPKDSRWIPIGLERSDLERRICVPVVRVLWLLHGEGRMNVRPNDSLAESFEIAFKEPYTSEYEVFFLKEIP